MRITDTVQKEDTELKGSLGQNFEEHQLSSTARKKTIKETGRNTKRGKRKIESSGIAKTKSVSIKSGQSSNNNSSCKMRTKKSTVISHKNSTVDPGKNGFK